MSRDCEHCSTGFSHGPPGSPCSLQRRGVPASSTSPRTVCRNCSRVRPSLQITKSAAARRSDLEAWLAMMLSICARSRPDRATTRSICVAGEESTTSTASTRERQRPDSTSKGTSKTTVWPGNAKAAWRFVSSPMRGCKSCSRLSLAVGSRNTSSRMRARSSAPVASMNSGPKRFRMASMPPPPAAVREREIASVSTSRAPQSTSIWATVLLPLPMPPVRPIRRGATPACHTAFQYQPSQPSTVAGPMRNTIAPAPARKGPKGT